MSKRVVAIVGLVLAFGGTAVVAAAMWPDRDGGASSADSVKTLTSAETGGGDPLERSASTGAGDDSPSRPGELPGAGSGVGPAQAGSTSTPAPSFALQPIPAEPPVRIRLKKPPAAGILFDVDSGEVLWERHAAIPRPIASLTKMMTALLIAKRHQPGERVMISPNAARTAGSATGVLPRGKPVPLEALLQALIMISANDAAVALAEHDAGSVPAFVKQMNLGARARGLDCTRFSTPNGLKDRGNRSCPLDLAALARADLADPRIARIARTLQARPRFPIKGKLLHLANNHYFLGHGLRGLPAARVTGLKTGFTDGAGRCYVTTARLGSRHLGVVLLDSPDPLRQVPRLLAAGFVATAAKLATP